MAENEERQRERRDANLPGPSRSKRGKNNEGFRLSREPGESEEKQRGKEHKDVKVQ